MNVYHADDPAFIRDYAKQVANPNAGATSMAQVIRDSYSGEPTPVAMLALRLGFFRRRDSGQPVPLDGLKLVAVEKLKDRYAVFVTTHDGEKATIVYDEDVEMFPSDKLVAQLRLLMR